MAANPYLNSDLSINRKELFTRAWSEARANLALQRKFRMASTLKECLAEALRHHWDLAKGYRATAQWRIVRDAKFAAASAKGARILQLEEALICAEMIDSTRLMLSEVAAIDAEISALRLAA